MNKQATLLMGDSSGLTKSAKGQLAIIEHRAIEDYLGRYAGLMLYLKEMDESVYAKLCAVSMIGISNYTLLTRECSPTSPRSANSIKRKSLGSCQLNSHSSRRPKKMNRIRVSFPNLITTFRC